MGKFGMWGMAYGAPSYTFHIYEGIFNNIPLIIRVEVVEG
jgi:hypothetical protein